MPKLLAVYRHDADLMIKTYDPDTGYDAHFHFQLVFYSNQKTALSTPWDLPEGMYDCVWYNEDASPVVYIAGVVHSYTTEGEGDTIYHLDFTSSSGTITHNYSSDSGVGDIGVNDTVQGELSKMPNQNKLIMLDGSTFTFSDYGGHWDGFYVYICYTLNSMDSGGNLIWTRATPGAVYRNVMYVSIQFSMPEHDSATVTYTLNGTTNTLFFSAGQTYYFPEYYPTQYLVDSDILSFDSYTTHHE